MVTALVLLNIERQQIKGISEKNICILLFLSVALIVSSIITY